MAAMLLAPLSTDSVPRSLAENLNLARGLPFFVPGGSGLGIPQTSEQRGGVGQSGEKDDGDEEAEMTSTGRNLGLSTAGDTVLVVTLSLIHI